jgi:hypothetical protein
LPASLLRAGSRAAGKSPVQPEITVMNATTSLAHAMPSADSVFTPRLTPDELRTRAPAVFATERHASRSPKYRFINTATIVDALGDVGLVPVEARQSRSRRPDGALYARHLIRFRPVRESIEIGDTVGELSLLNSHDGASNYQLIATLYRAVCKNGLVVRGADFGFVSVPHRGSVVDDVVAGALAIVSRLHEVAPRVEAMQKRTLALEEQIDFAATALAIRYADRARPDIAPTALLAPRREADDGADLWRVFNRVQEAVLRGGFEYRTAKQRAVRSRAVRAIREDLRINTALWHAAAEYLH